MLSRTPKTPQTYRFARWRAASLAALNVFILAILGLAVVLPPPSLFAGIVALVGMPCLGLLLLNYCRQLLTREPALVVSDTGLKVPLYFAGELRWDKIAGLRRRHYNKADFLAVDLNPGQVQAIAWRGPFQWLHRWRHSFGVPLLALVGGPQDITHDANWLWQQAVPASQRAAVPAPALTVAPQRSWANHGLLLLIAVVYAAELAMEPATPWSLTESLTLTGNTLLGLGSLSAARLGEHAEYGRLFTAPFLHTSWLHVIVSAGGLMTFGRGLERLAGWKWMLGIFALSTLSVDAISLMVMTPAETMTGAYGGIMGLGAAAYVLAWRLPDAKDTALKSLVLDWLMLSVISLGTVRGNSHHAWLYLSGSLVGAALGLALLKLWPRSTATPPLANAMAGAGLAFLAAAAAALWSIAGHAAP